MERELKKIDILPARFVKHLDDGKSEVQILIDGKILQNRIFDTWALEGIKKPSLLFIGIMTGVGFMQCTVCDAHEFKNLFKKKWNLLLTQKYERKQ